MSDKEINSFDHLVSDSSAIIKAAGEYVIFAGCGQCRLERGVVRECYPEELQNKPGGDLIDTPRMSNR